MFKVEHTVVINRPVAEVFAFATNPENDYKWQPDIEESKLISDGPLQVGSEMIETRKFLGRKLESTLRVTAFNPNNVYTFEVVKGPVPFEAQLTFESAPENGTKIIFEASGELGGFFKVANSLVTRQMQKEIEGNFTNLKHILEQEN